MIQERTDSSFAEVPDSALQDDGPAQGGVHEAPARVDEVWRRLRVYHLVGDISAGRHAAHRPGVGLATRI